MSNSLIKLKIKPEDNNKSRKLTGAWVLSCHILILFLVFIIFSFKGCTSKPKQNIIQVTLASPQQNQPAVQQQQKTQPTPKQTKKPEPAPKKVYKKPIKQTPAKTWKALDPSQIIKSSKTITKTERKPVAPHTYKKINAADIANSIKTNIKAVKFKNFTTDSKMLNYYDSVSSVLYARWQQPDRSVFGSNLPVVNVKISVNANGRVLNYKITGLSGIQAMDQSVKNLLSSLRQLPAPPSGAMTIDVSLELEN